MLGVLRDGDADAPLAPTEPIAPHSTVEAAQRAGFPVSLASTGDQPIAPAVEYAIGRIVQEGVTNAMRHAPAATAISVHIDRTADPVIVEILNDGAPEREGTAGFGLRGLAERAVHVGGSLQSGPVGAGRWSLRAELPTGVAAATEGSEGDEPR
jgi:signal transduction histidine kinase